MATTPAARAPVTVVAAVVLVVLGFSAFLVARCAAPDETEGATGDDGSGSPASTTTWPVEDPPNLILDRPDAFLEALRDELGTPLNVRRVVLYDTSAFAEVQDKDALHHLDEYDFREGRLDPVSTPVAAGRYETWKDEVFSLETVRPEEVRSIGRAALDEFSELEHPEISHLVIERGWDSDRGDQAGPVRVSVYVNDPIRGGSGHYLTDAHGEVLDISRS